MEIMSGAGSWYLVSVVVVELLPVRVACCFVPGFVLCFGCRCGL